jgi:3',5'-cyclic AMP phosphodiesterase CpdA
VTARCATRSLLARGVATLAAVAGAALGIAACGGAGAAAPPAPGSTLSATLVDRDGDGFLERGPGEPLRDRRDLGGRFGAPGRVLATFAQLSDTHVRDEESPARVPFLDRLGDPLNSTFRPQEALSTQTLAAAVRAVDRLHPEAVFVTGDIIDSAQADELAQARAVLDGGRVDPDTGAPGYEGVQESSSPDGFIYRPDVDAPRHPGLLAAAQRPFRSPGLNAPWYPALGNHDLLVQGEVPPTPRIEAVATGSKLVTALDPAYIPGLDESSAAATADSLLAGDLPGQSRTVAPDPRRRHLTSAELIAALHRGPVGGRLDYAVDVGPSVRAIVLDTVDRAGGSRGVVGAAQVRWLRDQLARAGNRWVIVVSHNPLESVEGGSTALAVLNEAPRVVAAIAGNGHRNTIEPHIATGGGYWLIGTSSLADWPQQARAFRLVEREGGVVLETWMIDHDGRGLAGVSRELAYLDAQGGRPKGFAGTATDRNARLYVPAR